MDIRAGWLGGDIKGSGLRKGEGGEKGRQEKEKND